MIGREHPLSIFRQILQTFGTHAKEQAHQRLIHNIQQARGRGGNVAERLEPAFLFLVENFLRVFQWIDRLALTAFGHFAQQIAHGLDARDRFVGQFHSAGFGNFQRQIQPLERIDPEIDLRTRVRRQPLVAISLRQQFPN